MKATCTQPFALQVDEVDGYPCVRILGECDSRAARPLLDQLIALLSAGRKRIVLDTRDVRYVDVHCDSILTRAVEAIQEAGGTVVVVDQSPPVERTLKLLGISQLVEVVPTTNQATTYLNWS
jgi:anti-anti-sigma factor